MYRKKLKCVDEGHKMITGISKLPYHLRLRKCGFLSQQGRRKRADMLEVFNIINEFTDTVTKRIFELNYIIRPERHKSMLQHRNRLDARHKFNLIDLRKVSLFPSEGWSPFVLCSA